MLQGMSFTADLWRSIEPIYAAILRHPFVTGFTDGSLPRASFQFYAVQDALYLREFARALSMAAARAPRDEWIIMFNEHAASALKVERALHEGFFAEFGLTPEDVASTPLAPTNLAYTSYLLAVAHGGALSRGRRGAAALLLDLLGSGQGARAARARRIRSTRAGSARTPPRSSAASSRPCSTAPTRWRATWTAPAREAMQRHFVTTSRYEWMFWDMGYREEPWPV